MALSDIVLGWFFSPIIAKLNEIQEAVNKMATTQQQFDTDFATLGTDLSALLALVTQLIAALAAAKGTGTVDLTSEDQGAQSMDSSIKSSIAAAQAALTPAS